MEDILEHIDEDVEIPDDEDDTDLEDTDMITDTIPMLKGNFVILAKKQKNILSNGQLISKCLFGVFTFFQKTNQNKSTNSKVEFVRSFFWKKRRLEQV